jgi:hypothetical protein
MDKCPHCNYNLRVTQLKCPICRNYVWRSPQIVAGAILTVIIGTGAVFTINYLAVNREPDKSEQNVINLPGQNPASSNPGSSRPLKRSNPNAPRPDWKKHF